MLLDLKKQLNEWFFKDWVPMIMMVAAVPLAPAMIVGLVLSAIGLLADTRPDGTRSPIDHVLAGVGWVGGWLTIISFVGGVIVSVVVGVGMVAYFAYSLIAR